MGEVWRVMQNEKPTTITYYFEVEKTADISKLPTQNNDGVDSFGNKIEALGKYPAKCLCYEDANLYVLVDSGWISI